MGDILYRFPGFLHSAGHQQVWQLRYNIDFLNLTGSSIPWGWISQAVVLKQYVVMQYGRIKLAQYWFSGLLMVPSHYLNQGWLITNVTFTWGHFQRKWMLTFHQCGPVVFIVGQFQKKSFWFKQVWKYARAALRGQLVQTVQLVKG